MGDNTVRHLRAINPDSPVLQRYYPSPKTCPRCGDDHPFDRPCSSPAERDAYARLTRSIIRMLNR